MKKRNREKKLEGLQVEVRNNNIEMALRILKRKLRDDNRLIELRKREFYRKPSDIKREKRELSKLRHKYRKMKED